MKNYSKESLKEEHGAVTALVVITVLTFVAVLLGAYLTVTTLRQSQLQSDIRIQEIYGQDIDRVNEIYENLVQKQELKNSIMVNEEI